MNTRERQPGEREDTPAVSEPMTAPQHTEHREAGDAFLAAADAAIELALSSAPEDFLRQNRQLGGQ